MRYYGASPTEVDGLCLDDFREFLRLIPFVGHRLDGWGEPKDLPTEASVARDGTLDVKKMLEELGVEIPK